MAYLLTQLLAIAAYYSAAAPLVAAVPTRSGAQTIEESYARRRPAKDMANQELQDATHGAILGKARPERNLVQNGILRSSLFMIASGNSRSGSTVTYFNQNSAASPTAAPFSNTGKAASRLPAELVCQPRNVTRRIRFGDSGCTGMATYAVCDGYCKTTARTKKTFPFLEVQARSCQMVKSAIVIVPLDCAPGRRRLPPSNRSPSMPAPSALALSHALSCACRQCSG